VSSVITNSFTRVANICISYTRAAFSLNLSNISHTLRHRHKQIDFQVALTGFLIIWLHG